MRTRIIELMPAFIRRREAKKLAPQAAEFQMGKILQAFKDVNPGAAKSAAVDLKAALMPLVSKKPNAPNPEQLMAEVMGQHIPTDRKSLEELSHNLDVLQTKSEVLDLLSLVVKAHVLDAKTASFRNHSLQHMERDFFDQDGIAVIKNFGSTQQKELSGMLELADAVVKGAKTLSRDDKIPGTHLALSTARFMAASAATARPLVEHRDNLLTPDLDDFNMQGLVGLQSLIARLIADKPEKAPRDNEMHDRYDAVLKAILKLQDKETQAKQKTALLERESKATSAEALKKLLSDTDKWFKNAPQDAPPDREMRAMYQRALKDLGLANARAEALTSLLTVNVADLHSTEQLHALMDQLSTWSKLVHVDKAQQGKLQEQQVNAIHRITALEEKVNRKQGESVASLPSPENVKVASAWETLQGWLKRP